MDPRGGDRLTAFDLVLRGGVYAFTGLATLVLMMAFGLFAMVAIGGTGAFTSDPPPEHPA